MTQRNLIREWLDGDAWTQDFDQDSGEGMLIFAKLLQEMGFQPQRIIFGAPILHPLYKASLMLWNANTNTVAFQDIPHEWDENNDDFTDTPVYNIIIKGAHAVRRNNIGTGACLGCRPAPLEDHNTTDYVAFRMKFNRLPSADGAMSITTNAPGGFTKEQLQQIDDFIPYLSRLSEVYMYEELTNTLLQTYLGTSPGKMVMKGQIRRGDGIDIRAVILFCDLRHSTRLSQELPRKEFLALLNDYFDCVAGAVLAYGGEVLRYIGDAALMIFPSNSEGEDIEACQKAAEAIREAWRRLHKLNIQRAKEKLDPIGFGIGIHIGEVTYGNIGIAERLEFTVIGEAANRAARLQDQTKVFNCPVVASEEFKTAHGGDWRYLGEITLRATDTTVPVYTPTCAELSGVITPP